MGFCWSERMKKEMEYTIRNLSNKDLAKFVKYESMLSKERKEYANFWQVVEKTLLSEEDLHRWFQNLRKSILNGDTVARVVEVNMEIVGLCTIIRHGKWQETSHVGELGIEILSSYRHKGLGSALLAEVIKEGKRRFEIIECNVFSINKHAIKLYRKFGFKKCGTWPKHIKKNGKYIDITLMCLEV